MEYNEALKLAKDGLKIYEEHYPSLKKQIKWQKVIIKSLEMQIPKKPIEICEFAEDDLVGLCPWCNDGVTNEMNYCVNCGKALDWNDTAQSKEK